MAKYKATGCARFLFFLIIFVPIAYFGSKYLMDSGKWDNIKGKLEDVSSSDDRSGIDSPSTFDYNRSEQNNSDLNEKFDQLLEKVNEQADKISEQEETIHRQNVLIDQLKQHLEQMSAGGGSISTGGSSGSSSGWNGSSSSSSSSQSGDKISLEQLLKEADKTRRNG